MLGKTPRIKKVVRLVGFTAAVVVVVALNSYRSFGSDGDDKADEPEAKVYYDPDIQLSGRSIRQIDSGL